MTDRAFRPVSPMPPARTRCAAVAGGMGSEVVMLVVSTETRRGVRSRDECGEDRAEAKDEHEQRSRPTAVDKRHGESSPKARRRPPVLSVAPAWPCTPSLASDATGLLSSDA